MGIQRVLKWFFSLFKEVCIIIALVLFVPGLPPYTEFTKSVKLPPTKALTGSLALNEKLNNVEILYKDRLVGPEAFADFNSDLYTGLYDGQIVKLSGPHISHIVQTGKPCTGSYNEPICGRPLGLKFHNGVLYVADAYYGILSIDVNNGKKNVLVPPNVNVEGKTPKWFNGLTVAKNGDIYWTDTSSNFHLEEGLFEVLSDPSGRLVHYNAKTKINTVLMDKLSTANGVALSSNEEFVIVSESITSRILRYYLKGPKNGTHDIFIDGLPGLPDNINLDEQGDFLVPLVSAVDPNSPSMLQTLLQFPLIRKFIARCMGLFQLLFKTIDGIYPSKITKIPAHTKNNPTVPKDVKFIYWHLATLHSPVLDLSYFLYLSYSEDIHVNYEKYVEYYYNEFTNVLVKLGTDPAKFPFLTLLDHLKTYSIMPLIVALGGIPLIILDEQMKVDVEEYETMNYCNLRQDVKNLIKAKLLGILELHYKYFGE